MDKRALLSDVYAVLLSDVPIAEAIVPTGVPNLELVPATIGLAGAEIELVSALSRETRLKRALHEVAAKYTYVLIDCPPSLGLLTLNALTAATEVLIEVNVAGQAGKSGIAPAELPGFLERCPVTVVGLMTMPPQAADPELNRPYFAALRELAARHDLRHLSMGTSQDYAVAAAEGATIVRLGTSLYRATA